MRRSTNNWKLNGTFLKISDVTMNPPNYKSWRRRLATIGSTNPEYVRTFFTSDEDAEEYVYQCKTIVETTKGYDKAKYDRQRK